MDDRVTYFEQLQEETGPVVLINKFNVAPEDAEHLLEVWADDAAYMKAQPGLHLNSASPGNGREHGTTFINVAVWESARALGAAFSSSEFRERAARYPDSTVAEPHVFEKVAVPGICVGC